MTNEELNEIITELSDAPVVIKTAIKIYNTTDNKEIKKELKEQLANVKATLERLDIMLEDLQWDFEAEVVNQILAKNS